MIAHAITVLPVVGFLTIAAAVFVPSLAPGMLPG
jgi:hypothetical protein